MTKLKLILMTVLSLGISSVVSAQDITKTNPLVMEWKTPYQTPPFSEIKTEHYLPAFTYAIEQARKDIDKLCNQKSKPTFENTILALDRTSLLDRVSSVFFNVLESETSPELQEIAKEISPILTQYSNDVSLNATLFQRVKTVYEEKAKLKLTKEQEQLLDKTYKGFARSGANLNEQDKEKYRAISQELSDLRLSFKNNVLASTNAYTLHITNEADLSGLPQDIKDLAASKAKDKKLEGWLFDLSGPSYVPFLKYADNRDLREKFYMAYNTRAYNSLNTEFDNQKNVLRIVQLRLEMANLLGYKTYADYVLEERMAENATNVNNFLAELTQVSIPYAKAEMEELQSYAKTLGFKDEALQRWDISYYSDKLKTEKYSINDNLLKPYFELEQVKKGVFILCEKLYGLKFKPAKNISTYQKDVVVYEVFDASNKMMAVLYMDFYARPSKRGGAWMTSFRGQSKDGKGKDIRPLVSLVLNFPPPTGNEPVLLTYIDFSTFLHEFGHALHGILSECTYNGTSGTSVPRDFVELPSQILENWGRQKEFLDLFAVHYKTKEQIPAELITKLVNAENFQAGFLSSRQLMYATLDMNWHSITAPVTMSVSDFEHKSIEVTEVLPVVWGVCTSTSFNHVFGGGYAAGYYGYKWAEVLDADAFSVFEKNGIFDAKTAASFRANILSKGGSDKPMNLYKNFRGQEPDLTPLLIRSGLKK